MIIEKPKCGIYKITNLKNNKSYIGQSSNIDLRWITHLIDSINNSGYSLIDKAIHSIGSYNFKLEIIEECPIYQLNDKEKFYIQKYHTIYPNGYNKNKGGNYYRNIENFNTQENIQINIEDLYKLKSPLSIKYIQETNEYIIYSIDKKELEKKEQQQYIRKNTKYKK